MKKTPRRLSELLIQSDDIVSIPRDSVPIIYIATHATGYVAGRVCLAINLLRSGCPAVQLIWVGLNLMDLVKNLLNILTLSSEQFFHDYRFNPQSDGTVSQMIITREYT